jgi:signal transduction histidine kinase
MWKSLSQYLFKNPEEIGLDNFLVLALCFGISFLGLLGTIINVALNLGLKTTLSTIIATIIFTPVYFYGRLTGKYIFSKYALIIISMVILNFQWFINFGSYGPILYLFVIVESFIVIFFTRVEKIIFTSVVFINVSALFLIEYNFPQMVGVYANQSARLMDLYSGLLIYLFISIFLINIALKFYKKQQEKAMLADKLKSAFLANMSHEIRTPMNGILGFAQLLREPNLSGTEQQEYLNIIEKSGDRMLNVINDIIDISKIESGLIRVDIRETDINEQCEYIYTFFRNEIEAKGLQFSRETSLPDHQAVIKTDPEKLYAVLINLVKNALKFTHRGAITFGYNRINIQGRDMLEFFVADTGIGIPAERQDAIFERFIQADIIDKHAYQGAGLGLAISKAFIEMLSGRIRVKSDPGKGSTFYFTLPYITS